MNPLPRLACAALVLHALLIAAPVTAETNPQKLPTATGRTIAARVSDAAVLANLTLATVAAVRAPERKKALGCHALRTVLAICGPTGPTRCRSSASTRRSRSHRQGRATRSACLSPSAPAPGARPRNRHYAGDVLAGSCVGSLVARVCR